MSIKVVLFDLDGTLLPMDQDVFVKAYFGLMAKKLAPYGYEPQKLIDAIWAGTAAMAKNDGSRTNEEVFWDVFSAAYGKDVKADIGLFDDYYRIDFPAVKESCGFNPEAAKSVVALKEKGFKVVLATNPIFPKIATEERMRWAGLEASDFEFYTTYETSRFAKPNPQYYQEIVENLGVSLSECVMVGNDVKEDMVAAKLGMKVFLLTDCLINKDDADISVYPNGGFAEMLDYISSIA